MGNCYFCFGIITVYLNKIITTRGRQQLLESLKGAMIFQNTLFPPKYILGRVSKRWGKVKVLLK